MTLLLVIYLLLSKVYFLQYCTGTVHMRISRNNSLMRKVAVGSRNPLLSINLNDLV